MAQTINDNDRFEWPVKVSNSNPHANVDFHYGPYDSYAKMADTESGVPSTVYFPGFTAAVLNKDGTVTEYQLEVKEGHDYKGADGTVIVDNLQWVMKGVPKKDYITFKGTAASENALPTGAATGDMYIVSNGDGTYSEFVWTGERWEMLGTATTQMNGALTITGGGKMVIKGTATSASYNGSQNVELDLSGLAKKTDVNDGKLTVKMPLKGGTVTTKEVTFSANQSSAQTVDLSDVWTQTDATNTLSNYLSKNEAGNTYVTKEDLTTATPNDGVISIPVNTIEGHQTYSFSADQSSDTTLPELVANSQYATAIGYISNSVSELQQSVTDLSAIKPIILKTGLDQGAKVLTDTASGYPLGISVAKISNKYPTNVTVTANEGVCIYGSASSLSIKQSVSLLSSSDAYVGSGGTLTLSANKNIKTQAGSRITLRTPNGEFYATTSGYRRTNPLVFIAVWQTVTMKVTSSTTFEENYEQPVSILFNPFYLDFRIAKQNVTDNKGRYYLFCNKTMAVGLVGSGKTVEGGAGYLADEGGANSREASKRFGHSFWFSDDGSTLNNFQILSLYVYDTTEYSKDDIL